MAKAKSIIFDYDGVVVDSLKNIHRAYRAICRELDGGVIEDEDSFRKAYASFINYEDFLVSLGIGKEKFKTAMEIFFRELAASDTRPASKIGHVLEILARDKFLGLVSGNADEIVMPCLRKYGLARYFTSFRTNSAKIVYFEKTQRFLDLLIELRTSPEGAIVIADRTTDFLEAKKAGIKRVILTEYGCGYDAEKIPEYQLETKVRTAADILEAVKEIEARE